jgi:hypothetical protein
MDERDQDEADDHQQKPCAEFAEVDEMPAVPLIGVDPDGGAISLVLHDSGQTVPDSGLTFDSTGVSPIFIRKLPCL